MKTFPIEALVAIVERETAIMNGELAKFGDLQWEPRTPAFEELQRQFIMAESELCTEKSV